MNDMKKMNADNVIQLLLYVSEQMMTYKDELCRLDSEVGDGDHGIGIHRGFYYLHKKLINQKTPMDIEQIFQLAHVTLMAEMGGASGIIFSALFKQEGLKEVTTLGVKEWKMILMNGLQQVQQFGHAHPGDKTMVDALAPAVEVIKTYEGDDLGFVFKECCKAAEEGKEKTKLYPAKFGRARFVKERSIGKVDPGAVSLCYILQAIYTYIQNMEKTGNQ